jgi:hypothetical protein
LALFGSSWAPFSLIFIDFGTIFIDFRHFLLTNSSGRVRAETENPRALRPGGTPQKPVSAIDQSYILRPDGLRRSTILWKILERSAPGEHPKKQFLQSINHIYFAPTDFDDR